MKKKKNAIIFLISILFIGNLNWPTGGPEIYLFIRDVDSATYKIVAIKADNSPIYDQNFNFTTEFDTASDTFFVASNEFTTHEGFDWVVDKNSVHDKTNDDLGFGFYNIKIIRKFNEPGMDTVFNFYLDFRMDPNRIVGSPDIKLYLSNKIKGNFSADSINYYYYDQNGLREEGWKNFYEGDTIKIWKHNLNQKKDFSIFSKKL